MLRMATTDEAKSLAATILLDSVGVEPCRDLEAFFWVGEDNRILWVVGYTGFIGKVCQIHVVNKSKTLYTPKKLLFAAFDYPFNYRGVEKILATMNSTNPHAIAYNDKLGFNEIYRFKGMHSDGGDIVLRELNKADCRWLGDRK
jgi:RimJ/RimL family protein N-acetyltransferase